MGDVSEEALLDYFFNAGGNTGKVKNAEILKTYKPFIGHSDLQLRAKYREEFKLIIDRIAVVKSENGEKYLVLKKKYRQLLQERDSKPQGDQDGSPATVHAAHWDAPDTTSTTQDEPMECGESESSATEPKDQEVNFKLVVPRGKKGHEVFCACGSESEQDEESTGSMGSAAVALDPVEKEWIYSAAGARVPDLSQLLRQDPTLANKKVTALHWAAKHGNKDMATLVAEAGADVNTKSVRGYTPLHIAALHGHQHILELLIGTYGAKESVRDYSGRLACHYLNVKEPDVTEEECDIREFPLRGRHRNRKLASLFSSRKKWGSAEELAPIQEERSGPQHLNLPPFRPRKFSR
uniref:SOWAHA-C winged helix-turn-helix domain-containing protein n=1 Tax=Neogobius melanostomus TaxID=47308 RepID=A0A8C6WSQ3_9GOBI